MCVWKVKCVFGFGVECVCFDENVLNVLGLNVWSIRFECVYLWYCVYLGGKMCVWGRMRVRTCVCVSIPICMRVYASKVWHSYPYAESSCVSGARRDLRTVALR